MLHDLPLELGDLVPFEGEIRRPLAMQDPVLIALYERLVAAREGVHHALRSAIIDRDPGLVCLVGEVELLVNLAQELVEQHR
jgi:hypothetical protein